jgi:putative membrane protein
MTMKYTKNVLGITALSGALLTASALGFSQQPPAGSPSPMGSQQAPGNTPGSMGQPNPGQMPDDQHMDTGSKKMSKSGDETFLLKAAEGGNAEVMVGKLAAEKASDPDVKAFGQQMVDDHTKANEQLKAVASKKGMTVPDSPGPKHQSMYEKLSKMQGADFDKAYVKAMVKDHEEDVKDFQKEADKGKDEQIKGYASSTLPVLQQHLDKVKALQGKVSGGSGSKGTE